MGFPKVIFVDLVLDVDTNNITLKHIFKYLSWDRNSIFNENISVIENCNQGKMSKLKSFDMTKNVKVIHSLT